MIYLFLQSVVPTVPAGWLTFAEGAVYKAVRPAGAACGASRSPTDQQLAGAIMKIGGSIVPVDDHRVPVVHAASRRRVRHEYDYKRGRTMPTAEIVGHDDDR